MLMIYGPSVRAHRPNSASNAGAAELVRASRGDCARATPLNSTAAPASTTKPLLLATLLIVFRFHQFGRAGPLAQTSHRAANIRHFHWHRLLGAQCDVILS